MCWLMVTNHETATIRVTGGQCHRSDFPHFIYLNSSNLISGYQHTCNILAQGMWLLRSVREWGWFSTAGGCGKYLYITTRGYTEHKVSNNTSLTCSPIVYGATGLYYIISSTMASFSLAEDLPPLFVHHKVLAYVPCRSAQVFSGGSETLAGEHCRA
jgi:hypothetical protein